VREVVLGLLDALARGLLLVDGPGLGPLEDVLFVLGEVSKDLGREVEVLGDDRLGRVGEPVGEDKGRLFGKVAVVENQEELGAVLTKTLERVRNSAGEVPKVT
jgi:hypothetical protein